MASLVNAERGDPQATADAIVDAENPPRRLAVGSWILPRARAAYAERLATWEAWEAILNAAQGDSRSTSAVQSRRLAEVSQGTADIPDQIPQMAPFRNRTRP